MRYEVIAEVLQRTKEKCLDFFQNVEILGFAVFYNLALYVFIYCADQVVANWRI